MIDVNQLRRGVNFLHDNELLKVTEYSHNKPGRGKATIRVSVRNMRTGANLQLTFSSGDRVQDVRLDKRAVQYLYDDGLFYVFMDTETYEQWQIAHDTIGDDAKFLTENMDLELLFYEREVLDYNLPLNADYDVVEAENAIAGDTASGATKEVILQTGLKVKTPLFVNAGDRIRVDTRTGEYVTRV
jgi:elongation factor P